MSHPGPDVRSHSKVRRLRDQSPPVAKPPVKRPCLIVSSTIGAHDSNCDEPHISTQSYV